MVGIFSDRIQYFPWNIHTYAHRRGLLANFFGKAASEFDHKELI